MPTRIVTANPPKRSRKPKPPSPDVPARIVTSKRGKRIRPEPPPDPEADAEVAEWFKRNIVPPVR